MSNRDTVTQKVQDTAVEFVILYTLDRSQHKCPIQNYCYTRLLLAKCKNQDEGILMSRK